MMRITPGHPLGSKSIPAVRSIYLQTIEPGQAEPGEDSGSIILGALISTRLSP